MVQHGAEISCLPYTIHPFAALDIAQAVSDRDITISGVPRLSPSSIEPQLFAAYPVLIPLYLAQYEVLVPGKPQNITFFLEAFEPHGRIRVEQLDFVIEEMRKFLPQRVMNTLKETDVLCVRGSPSRFFRVSGFHVPDGRGAAEAIAYWLDDAVSNLGARTALVKRSTPFPSDDPRIRPLLFEERKINQRWMTIGSEIESTRRILSSMKSSQGAINTGADSQGIFDSTISSLESKIAAYEEQRTRSSPAWWKEWLDLESAGKS